MNVESIDFKHFLCRTVTSFVRQEGTMRKAWNSRRKGNKVEVFYVEKLHKTKTVSDELGVNPTTVQRWVKYFDVPCKKNALGHYLFSDSDVLMLKKIQQQLSTGLRMSQVKVNVKTLLSQTDQKKQGTSQADTIEKLDLLFLKIENIERQLEEKANEVVAIQVLQHRKELEKLVQKISKLQSEIEQLKVRNNEETNTVQFSTKNKELPKRNWLASLLSLL